VISFLSRVLRGDFLTGFSRVVLMKEMEKRMTLQEFLIKTGAKLDFKANGSAIFINKDLLQKGVIRSVR